MQALIDSRTRVILGVGFFDAEPPAGQEVVGVSPEQIVHLGGPGTKTIGIDGAITSTIPQVILDIEARETQERADRAATIALLKPIALGAVGKPFNTLNAAEVRALSAILFWKEGALDNQGRVRPLNQWLRE